MWMEGICIGGWGSHVYARGHLATSSPTHPIKPALALPIREYATYSLSTRGRRRRNNMSVGAASTTAPDALRKGIAEFYDESSGVWEDIWGDHMHHGFYDPASDVSISDHRAAQIRMIDQSLAFASLSGTPLSLHLDSLQTGLASFFYFILIY